MRIISGAWRGRVLKTPPGATTRPTADRTREALFSMLASRLGSFEDLTVADIFAGTGALSPEALSLGEGSYTLVDHDHPALKATRVTMEMPGAKGEILAVPVSTLGPARRPYDLLLFDPPYGSGGAGALLEKLTRLGWAADSAWAAVETRSDEQVSAEGWTLDAERRHGIAKLSVLCRTTPTQPD